MNNAESKISVCIPVYNGEKTISKNLNSLISQNYKNFEILISNNKSTDKTLQICKKFKKNDPRIKIYNQKKKLPVFKNFKFLIKKSKGNYVMWLASHHRLSKNFLKENYKILSKNKELVASMGVDYFSTSFSHKDKQKFNFEHDLYNNLIIFFRHCWRSHGVFYSLIRRNNLFKILSSLNHYLASDWIFMIHLIFQGKIFRSLNTYLILGREGNSSKKKKPNYINKKYESIIPLYYFTKHFYDLLNKDKQLPFLKKKKLLLASLYLNIRYLISMVKI
jgi:glycosyltransferase involved in cell wall biosynthesis